MDNEIKNQAEHYICLGGCRGVSPVPGVCQAPDCANHKHELVKCDCADGLHNGFKPKEKLWFKRKLYGWGWTPVSWEGWLTTLLYIVFIILIFNSVDVTEYSASDVLVNFLPRFIVLTIMIMLICYKKGEKPRWQWGKRKDLL